jgi:hypothetical protein
VYKLLQATIIKFNKEIDMALQLEKMKDQEAHDEVKAVLDRKLKPKGGLIGGKTNHSK